MNFDNFGTVQQVLNAYKKWLLKETNAPSFMQEPLIGNTSQLPAVPNSLITTTCETDSQISGDDDKSVGFNSEYSSTDNFQRTPSVSSVSVTGFSLASFNPAQEQTRIGYIRSLQIFLFHSSNLLLNRTNLQRDKIKNVCCYTLEIYKMFIRKIKMDYYTWYSFNFSF